jgi:hypothetical protein
MTVDRIMEGHIDFLPLGIGLALFMFLVAWGIHEIRQGWPIVVNLLSLTTVPLLVIDDLGTERPSDWNDTTLFDLLKSRDAAERATIYTANLPVTLLHDPRVASLIQGTALLVPLIVSDYRALLAQQRTSAETGKGRTAELALAILHTALNDAVAWEILKRNPAEHVSAPKFERKKTQAMTLAQAQAFMAAAGGRLDLRKPIMRKNGKKMTPITINPRLEPRMGCATRRAR